MNEVSCRILDVFFHQNTHNGLPPKSLFRGIDYSLQHLRDKYARIDWPDFIRICENAGRIWSDDELLSIGASFLNSPYLRWTQLVSRALFNEKDFYRWQFTPKLGVGNQIISCVTPKYEEISDNKLRLSLKVHEGYESFPWEFLVITKGVMAETPRLLGNKPAKVDLFETPRGGYYIVEVPGRSHLYRRIFKALSKPFMIRAAAQEIKETHEQLQQQSQQIEDAYALLDRHIPILKTAFAINSLVQRELAITSTSESIVSALVEEGGFRGAVLNVDAESEGMRIQQYASRGETPHTIRPMIVPIHVRDQSIGYVYLWNEQSSPNEQEGLLKYVIPTLTMALDDAIKVTTLNNLHNRLEMTVAERTDELLHVRDELSGTIDKLVNTQSARDKMLANISHEFRTPLTLIQGLVERLLSNEMKEDSKEQFQVILNNTRRLLTLVNQLLDLSKIDAGAVKLRIRKGDIGIVVRGVTSIFKMMAKQKGVALKVELPARPVTGWFDTDCLEKIIVNLLTNAIKFTAKGGSVTVRVTPRTAAGDETVRTGLLIISVADTGIGMASTDVDKVFNRFYQLNQGDEIHNEGTGLGLALTKELVELHKGNISVISTPGKGSMFTVTLPVDREHYLPEEIADDGPPLSGTGSDDDQTSPTTPKRTRLPTGQKLPLLLIVENDVDMQSYIQSSLTMEYRTMCAKNGEDGLRKAINYHPDLIISDVMMGKMDGFEMCRILKTNEHTSHIPVILLTAIASPISKIEGLETGADDYIMKPFDVREMQARVKNLIDQRKKIRERFRKEVTLKPQEVSITSVDERFISQAVGIVEANLSRTDFSSEYFAKEMHLSRMQLHRKIRALTGLSPWQFVRRMRLMRAADLLKKRTGNIAAISYEVGYDTPSKFTQAFRKEFGKTPSEYQAALASIKNTEEKM